MSVVGGECGSAVGGFVEEDSCLSVCEGGIHIGDGGGSSIGGRGLVMTWDN
jgi:hypothetical protein